MHDEPEDAVPEPTEEAEAKVIPADFKREYEAEVPAPEGGWTQYSCDGDEMI